MTVRGTMLRLHLAIAVALGALILLLGLSGTVLVFRDELDAALMPVPRVEPRPTRVPLQSLANAAALSQPGLRPRAVFPAEASDEPVRIAMRGRADEQPEVFVDPYTGAVLGARWRERSPLSALRLLHTQLYLGPTGSALVAGLGVGFVLQGLTGFYLWWPFLRRPGRRLSVRWGRPWPVVGYDLHKAVGAVSLAFNVPIALTGALLAFASLGSAGAPGAATAGGRPLPTSDASDRSLPVRMLTLDALAERAAATLPGRLLAIELPPPGGLVAVATLRVPGDLAARGSGVVAMRVDTGEVLAVQGGRGTSVAARALAVLAPLHYGDYGGRTSKLLYAAGGLSAPALVLTGYGAWLARHRRTKLDRPLR